LLLLLLLLTAVAKRVNLERFQLILGLFLSLLSLFDLQHLLILLKTDFSAKLLEILVGLLKDLHQTTVFLRVDQVNVGIHIVVFKRLDAVTLFLVLSVLLFPLFLVEMSFGVERITLDLHCALLVELDELFLVVKDFFQEFLPPGTTAVLLTASHLLLEPI
jgi:hypothetical protein